MAYSRKEFETLEATGYKGHKLSLLKELLTLSDRHGYAHKSVDNLARSIGHSARTVQRDIRDFERDGAIRVEYEAGMKRVNHYFMNWEYLISLSGRGDTVSPHTEAKGDSWTAEGDNRPPKGDNRPPSRVTTRHPRTVLEQIRPDIEQETPPTNIIEISKGVKPMAKHSSIIKVWNSWNEETASKPYKAVSPIPPEIMNGVIKGTNGTYEAIGRWIDNHSNWEELWEQVVDELRHNRYFDGTKSSPTITLFFAGKPATFRGGKHQEAWRPTIDRLLEGEFNWLRPSVAVNTKVFSKPAAEWHKASGIAGDEEF